MEGKHLEITNLIINGHNDSVEEINQLCDFVVDELGPEVPLHFSRVFPYYKMDDISPTNPEILFKHVKLHKKGHKKCLFRKYLILKKEFKS